MKSTHYVSLAAFLLLSSFTPNLRAQAFMKTDASIVKVLSDSTYLTAMEVTFPPGYKTNTHTHAAQWVYALTDGTLKVMYTDGQTQEFSMKAGDNFYAGPERPHMTQNITDKPVRFLLIELKEHPYKEMKMKK
jgi:quercetin dioxygenase-like cupin family protein